MNVSIDRQTGAAEWPQPALSSVSPVVSPVLQQPFAVGGVLLAAGRGERFRAAGGADKLLARLPGPDGEPVALASLRRLQAALAPWRGPVVAVVRPDREDHAELATLLRQHGAQVVLSPRAAQGMGASLADALAAWPANQAVVVALGDMPFVAEATIIQVVQRLAAGASVVRPRWQGQAGHPVGFAAPWREALRGLQGDQSARELLRAAGVAVQWVSAEDDPGCCADIDTPEDLQRDFR